MALFGENGAGKTTLLKVIAGALVPTNGEVRVGGRLTNPRWESERPRIGHVLAEDRSFFWRLSGYENLKFFAALENIFGASADRKIDELLHEVGLDASASRRVGEYSTGMRQRLGIARGLLTDPEVLLLDEPTRSLDPAAAEEVWSLLSGRLAMGRALLVATNRFEDAQSLCDTVAVLRRGRLVANRSFDKPLVASELVSFVRENLLQTSREPAE